MARISLIRQLFRITHITPSLHRSRTLPPSNYNRLFSDIPTSSSPVCIQDRPSSIYHPCVQLLHSCQNHPHLFQIQAQLITCGVFLFWSARLLKTFSDLGDIDNVFLVFRYIDSPGQFVVNNVIKAFSLSSVPNRAVVFYFDMLKNAFFPNSYTFVWLFGSCAKMACVDSAQKCHGQAVKNGVDCFLPVQNSLIHLYGCCGVLEYARKVFDEMSHRDLVSWNSIVDCYASAGDLGLAHSLFDVMLERNVVSWNVMITGYLKGNNPGCVLMLFRKMMKGGLRGNNMTIVSAITACGRSARLKEGRSVHGYLIRTSLNFNIIVHTSLIDMYSKCRKVKVAQRIFDGMVMRNLVCWNAMVLGHCIHGNPEDGLSLFAEMVDGEAVPPDEVTYIGILCACARAGLLTEGKMFFSQMNCKYGIKRNFAHYWCMANLYAGVGLIEEAVDMLRSMPEGDGKDSSESLVWVNLLSLCRFQTSATLGKRVANFLIDKEPQNFWHYQLLLNVYAAAGQWDGVVRVKEMLKERRMGKMPGCSLLDLNKIVHEYKVGRHWLEKLNEINEDFNLLARNSNP